jgi:ABC-type spermidine/putrescine transport system permease subunit II
MTTWQAFQAMAFHSLDLAVYAWPISVALAVLAAGALMVGAPLRNQVFRRRLRLMLFTYVIPLVIVAIGAFLRYDGPRAPEYIEPPAWRGAVLWGAVVVHLAALIAAVTLMKGARLRVAAIVLPGIWLSLSSGFMAGIAIAGVGP